MKKWSPQMFMILSTVSFPPADSLKAIAHTCSHVLLNAYNACLKEVVFPQEQKAQKLVLISKGKRVPRTPGAYDPLCLLNTAGKLLEKLLKPRLLAAA